MIVIALAVPALLAGVVAAPASAQSFGFTDDFTDVRDAGLAAGAGARVARIYMCWCDVEPVKGAPVFLGFDARYSRLRAAGLKPLWVVIGSPRWARTEGQSDPSGLYPPDAAHTAAWGAFVREVARRYPDSEGIEVWNEPNLPVFFRPRSDPSRFVELLKEAYAEVKSVRPSMPVVAGGISGSALAPEGGHGDADFLSAMYRAGAKDHMDAIGDHPYPGGQEPTTFSARVRVDRLRKVRDENGDSGLPIWITETGISMSGDGTTHPRVSEQRQAEVLAHLYRSFHSVPDIPVLIFFRLVDMHASDSLWETGMGIFDRNRRPKSAVGALRGAIADPALANQSLSLGVACASVSRGQSLALAARGAPAGATYRWDLNDNNDYERPTGDSPYTSAYFNALGPKRLRVEASDPFDVWTAEATINVLPLAAECRDALPPRFASLTLAPASFRAATTGSSIASAGGGGADVSFRTDEVVTVRFGVERRLVGRRRGRRCLPALQRKRPRRACVRYGVLRGYFKRYGAPGVNRFRFSGRLDGRTLAPGLYRLVGVATDRVGNRTTAIRLPFQIVR